MAGELNTLFNGDPNRLYARRSTYRLIRFTENGVGIDFVARNWIRPFICDIRPTVESSTLLASPYVGDATQSYHPANDPTDGEVVFGLTPAQTQAIMDSIGNVEIGQWVMEIEVHDLSGDVHYLGTAEDGEIQQAVRRV